MRTVFVYLNNYFQEDWKGERQLHKAVIEFNDGSHMTADLGDIILYSDKVKQDDEAITMVSGTTSSDGSSSQSYQTQENVSLLSIESTALSFVNCLDLKIAGINYKDFSKCNYNRNSSFLVTSKFATLKNSRSEMDIYDIKPKLYYKRVNGKVEYIRIYNVTNRIYFYSFYDVLCYLMERGLL